VQAFILGNDFSWLLLAAIITLFFFPRSQTRPVPAHAHET
jgi:hypothetical protein